MHGVGAVAESAGQAEMGASRRVDERDDEWAETQGVGGRWIRYCGGEQFPN